MVKWFNDNIDIRRGIKRKDFMWGRSWVESEAKRLWTNIEGVHPGGNQQMPSAAVLEGAARDGASQVSVSTIFTGCLGTIEESTSPRIRRALSVGSTHKVIAALVSLRFLSDLNPCLQGGNAPTEFFGHEYLANLHQETVAACAAKAGVTLDQLDKKSFFAMPAEGTPADEYDGIDADSYLTNPGPKASTLASLSTPFIPSPPPQPAGRLDELPAALPTMDGGGGAAGSGGAAGAGGAAGVLPVDAALPTVDGGGEAAGGGGAHGALPLETGDGGGDGGDGDAGAADFVFDSI